MNELQGEEAYEQLQKLLKEKRDNFRVMEKEVDIDVQMAYFDAAKKAKKDLPDADVILEKADKLYDDDVDVEEKKTLLSQLASLEDVRAFRKVESFNEKAGKDLDEWANMAYQESLMVMESAFSDEEKVFVAGGMGGKDDKLRYFATFLHADLFEDFTDLQKNLIRKEIKYQFEKVNAELEDEEIKGQYFMFTCLIPLEVNISVLFRDIIDEINQFGYVLGGNFMVTNVKRLSYKEVDKFIKEKMNDTFDEIINDDNDDEEKDN
ncbi:MAG: hypothetical protein U9Q84_09910 [Thermodesulfobacteriota bacterium]|nr:hypothetical protein [Thermodesulfobacteriota bacterium]MEA3448078.1 hypothetical protein [Bacteroidota bacterium]